jgi:hypothetical protein
VRLAAMISRLHIELIFELWRASGPKHVLVCTRSSKIDMLKLAVWTPLLIRAQRVAKIDILMWRIRLR